MKRTILLGLNELNFDYIKYYANKGKLPNFKYLFDNFQVFETISEKKHELLEPWIQWVTVHTGKNYADHKIFRLGDITESNSLNQIFEYLEEKGATVGAISPFNADNRLKNPEFFVPDPWTKTKVSGNWLIKGLYEAIHQSVNDNANGKLRIKTIITLIIALLRYVPFSRLFDYLKLINERKLPGVKAIILDNLLADVFISLDNSKKPIFSNLFLNSGAHIQHHYLFNSIAYKGNLKNPEWYCQSAYDPLSKVLIHYDKIIGRLLKQCDRIIIATGLHQQPHKHMTFYWRINKHAEFLKKIGVVNFIEVIPRMSRDFLVNFDSKDSAKIAEQRIKSFVFKKDLKEIFSVDNRGESLFVELIYPDNIIHGDSILSKILNIEIENFKSFISFVAIKNGEHNGTGYLTSSFDLELKKNKIELTQIRGIIEKSVIG